MIKFGLGDMRIDIKYFLAIAGLAITSCSSPNPNPSSPQANTGYVDFYTDESLQLAWEVKRLDERTGELRTVFSKYRPLPGTLLRLAVPPGNQRFQIWFMNCATEGPEALEVLVENAKVTPVHVTLNVSGGALVQRKVYGFRPSAKGYGRGTKIVRDQTAVYKIGAVAEAPQTYQPRERMAYFASENK